MMDAPPPSKKELDQEKPVSDTEEEKPVREQLKKATIDAQAQSTQAAAGMENSVLAETGAVSESLANGTPTNTDNAERGRLHGKRSFDETEEEPNTGNERSSSVRHPRKRSRDNIIDEEHPLNIARSSGEQSREDGASNGVGVSGELKRSGDTTSAEDGMQNSGVDGIGSPKTKRSRMGEKSEVQEGEAEETEKPKSTLDGIEDAVGKVPHNKQAVSAQTSHERRTFTLTADTGLWPGLHEYFCRIAIRKRGQH